VDGRFSGVRRETGTYIEGSVLETGRGPRRDEVIGGWRELHEDLHNLYYSPNIIKTVKSRRMRWAEHIARIGTKMNAYRILVGKSEGMRLVGRRRHGW
jgi:hypothetical protein